MLPSLLVLILDETWEHSLMLGTGIRGRLDTSTAAPSSAERMSSGVPLRLNIVAQAILHLSEQATMHRADLFSKDLVAFGV